MRRALIVMSLALSVAATGCSELIRKAGANPLPSASGNLIVPNLIGRTREEAMALVKAAGFTADVESSRPVECEDAPQVDGQVSCQDPPAGKIVSRYTTVQINVYQTRSISGAIVRAQLKALLGLPPDKAKAKLVSYGHDGEVTVARASKFVEGCGEDRVCGFDVSEAGIGVHDSITLYVNPGLKLARPPGT